MPPLTWQNVAAPDFRGVTEALTLSGRSLDAGLGGAADAIGKFGDARKENALADILRQTQGMTDPGQIRNALAGMDTSGLGSGQFLQFDKMVGDRGVEATRQQAYEQLRSMNPLLVAKQVEENRHALELNPALVRTQNSLAGLNNANAGSAAATAANTRQTTDQNAQLFGGKLAQQRDATATSALTLAQMSETHAATGYASEIISGMPENATRADANSALEPLRRGMSPTQAAAVDRLLNIHFPRVAAGADSVGGRIATAAGAPPTAGRAGAAGATVPTAPISNFAEVDPNDPTRAIGINASGREVNKRIAEVNQQNEFTSSSAALYESQRDKTSAEDVIKRLAAHPAFVGNKGDGFRTELLEHLNTIINRASGRQENRVDLSFSAAAKIFMDNIDNAYWVQYNKFTIKSMDAVDAAIRDLAPGASGAPSRAATNSRTAASSAVNIAELQAAQAASLKADARLRATLDGATPRVLASAAVEKQRRDVLTTGARVRELLAQSAQRRSDTTPDAAAALAAEQRAGQVAIRPPRSGPVVAGDPAGPFVENPFAAAQGLAIEGRIDKVARDLKDRFGDQQPTEAEIIKAGEFNSINPDILRRRLRELR